jgi:hypothetical protein
MKWGEIYAEFRILHNEGLCRLHRSTARYSLGLYQMKRNAHGILVGNHPENLSRGRPSTVDFVVRMEDTWNWLRTASNGMLWMFGFHYQRINLVI